MRSGFRDCEVGFGDSARVWEFRLAMVEREREREKLQRFSYKNPNLNVNSVRLMIPFLTI